MTYIEGAFPRRRFRDILSLREVEMIVGRQAFLMIALTALGIAAETLSLGSCGTRKSMESQTSTEYSVVIQPISERSSKEKKTLFEKFDRRRDCPSNPALCDGDFFEMDIKKELKTDINQENGVSSTFCAGGCSQKSAFKWSLQW
jgi:hypothetical protein